MNQIINKLLESEIEFLIGVIKDNEKEISSKELLLRLELMKDILDCNKLNEVQPFWYERDKDI